MNSVYWTCSPGFFRTSAAVLLAAGCLWFIIRSIRASGLNSIIIYAETARLIALLMMVAALLKLERVEKTGVTKNPECVVLVDGSGSMDTQDVLTGGHPVSRASWISNFVAASGVKVLEERYRVVSDSFPQESEGGKGTDIASAIDNAVSRRPNLKVVMLLSDGDWNDGDNPITAATKLRMKGIRLFCVGVGTENYLPDVALEDVSAPAFALADEHLAVPFAVQNRMSRDVRTEVIIISGERELVRKRISIPAHGTLRDSVIIVPQGDGETQFVIKIPEEPGELYPENNSMSFKVAVKRQKLKVLVYESRTRWEYRFLRNALVRDPGVECTVVLRDKSIATGSGSGYIDRFPSTITELAEYDVVFLGDVALDAGDFNESDAELLEGLVSQQGSGLVFLPGMQGKQASFKDSILEKMMPVIADYAHPNGFGSDTESAIVLTDRGSGHRLTLLEEDPEVNQLVWRDLPGFYWYAPVIRSKAGSEVLAVHAQARNADGRIPLLVTGQYGNGKVLYMATDSAWRWRRGVEDKYHYRFWGQVVRWMSHQRHMSEGEGVRIAFSPELPSEGERVFLHVTVIDRSGYPLKNGSVQALIEGPDDGMTRIDLLPEGGEWGVFTGSFQPVHAGAYSVKAVCEQQERTGTVTVQVMKMEKEIVGSPIKKAFLKELAEITGGGYAGYEEADALIGRIRTMPEAEPVESRFRLWCHPFYAAGILLCLTAHWVLRKLAGMI